ncbi:MAG: hypothetical protein BMS9Abin01_1039 [Gammaproteobacteria bacterium]|nr:MAG: hypothetical protein BMS9Abin01_1039 [Gammaproteobacteria bacterium]
MRNESRVTALVMALLLVLVPFVHAIAQPASESESGNPGRVTETQAESAPATRNEERGEGVAEESPAEPFIPSESISADSAVSFPVDI